MSAAFQYNLKRRPFFRPLQSAGHRIGAKTHKHLKGDTFRVAKGASYSVAAQPNSNNRGAFFGQNVL
jgi:hypothetical protein